MPATEKTWRDQARMHVIFGVTTLLMLIGTIWMLAKDHNREWRQYQLDDRAKDRWSTEAQLAQAEAEASGALVDLREKLAKAQIEPINEDLIKQFKQTVEAEDKRLTDEKMPETAADFSGVDKAVTNFAEAKEDSAKAKARRKVLGELNVFIREAKRRENNWLTSKKLSAAKLTAEVSKRGIAVGEGRPTADLEAVIQGINNDLVVVDARLANAKDYRLALEGVVKSMQSSELELEREIASVETDLNRMRDALPSGPVKVGEWINRAPVVDALYTGDIRLDQIWLPDMKINYNFSSVARYDRCIVCHRAIDKTAPGSAVEPAYPAIPRDQRERTIQLATPAEAPATKSEDGKDLPAPTLMSVYGLQVSTGQVDPDDITAQVVMPQSLAAQAGLQSGDVILAINGGKVESVSNVDHYLLTIVNWGEPQSITIRRGLDQPYTSHPRLDLFVGSTSPHKKGEMGCTICHDGQGSATDFKWASHTPNDPRQAREWTREHGWFDNHHWIFPMMPQRFIESNCLKWWDPLESTCRHASLSIL